MRTFLRIKPVFLCVSFAVLVIGLAASVITANVQANDYAQMQLDAARRMEAAEAFIKDRILGLGIEIEADDLNQTGLIGPEFTELTSTMGDPKAKRSTLNPEFAAAMVRYYHNAGVGKGDSIVIGTSGSFPGFVIASLCAAAEMELDVRIIASLGASMHGATRVNFNVFDFLDALKDGGFADFNLVGISCGSSNDNGGGAMEELLYENSKQLSYDICTAYAKKIGAEFIYYSRLADSISRRLELCGTDVKLFVNIGGAAPNSGISSYALDFPQGLVLDFPPIPNDATRGLNYEYAALGIPVLNLLNVKLLCQENNIPFDPVPLSKAGETAVYSEISYNRILIILTLVLSFAVFTLGVFDGHRRRKAKGLF